MEIWNICWMDYTEFIERVKLKISKIPPFNSFLGTPSAMLQVPIGSTSTIGYVFPQLQN